MIRTTAAPAIAVALLACASTPPAPGDFPIVSAFETDGCTCAPDLSIGCCCEAHDFEYWQGGTRSQRRAADRALRRCIAEAGKPVLSRLYYWGVRLGGTPALGTSWRWGFGRAKGAGYSPRPEVIPPGEYPVFEVCAGNAD